MYSDIYLQLLFQFLGHGLSHDLIVLKIVHQKIIDTVQVFPHPRGLPFKQNLKMLIRNELCMNIQSSDHDSKEDAIACMHVMLHRARNEITAAVASVRKRKSSQDAEETDQTQAKQHKVM